MIRLRLSNLKFNEMQDETTVFNKVIKRLKLADGEYKNIEISKHSIDARKKDDIRFVYNVDIDVNDNLEQKLIHYKDVTLVKEYKYEIDKISSDVRPIIIGAGPSGLFSALTMIEAGLKPIIIERGKKIEEREIDVKNLMENAIFDENSNIVFGEGGAGTFSDGKLTTGVKDTRKQKVLDTFVEYGASKEIKFVTKPHIGTDVIRNVVKNMRNTIIENGGEFHFSTLMEDIICENNKIKGVKLKQADKSFELYSEIVCICTGHSSYETFKMLYERNVNVESKPFAIGVRIEHKRDFINSSQYGKDYDKSLPTADYKLAVKADNDRNVYTFCMCPGGVVVPSMSDKDSIVVNGMSYFKRDLENSNSAILVNVTNEDFVNYTNDTSPLNGLVFQRKLESETFKLGGGNYNAPVQMVVDFIDNKKSTELKSVTPSYKPNYTLSNLNEIFPEFLSNALKDGLLQMDKKIKGFASNDSIITAIETRSSSPVRILRDENLQTNIDGLFAVGEGSGYSGGITSSCIDGIKCAESVVKKLI